MNKRMLQTKQNLPSFENFIYYLAGFLLIFFLKLFYSSADSESLSWILAPTALCVSLITRIPFTRQPGAGYVNHSLRFIIAPSCSGVQFMIVLIALLLFSFIHRVRRKAVWSILVPGFSFLYTILVNSLRITLAIYIPLYFPGLTRTGGLLTPEKLHTLIGTLVYFSALLLVYPMAERAVSGKQDILFRKEKLPEQSCDDAAAAMRKTAAGLLFPVFWYFLIVLGLPFLNRAWQKGREQFMEYTALVLCGCTVVLFLPAVGFLLKLCRYIRSRSTNP